MPTIDITRKIKAMDVIERLADLFVFRGTLEYIRSDNGPEFVSRQVRHWLKASGVQTLYIEPGSPWENGYIELFNGKLRDELLNREIFETLLEAKVLVERWKIEYNTVRPHSSLNYQPPAPEVIKPEWLENAVAPLLKTGTTYRGRSIYLKELSNVIVIKSELNWVLITKRSILEPTC